MYCSTSRRRLPVLQLVLLVIGGVMFPVDALAWGPVAHIDISLQLLAGAVALSPTVASLIRRNAADFIYGGLAADAVVGKNLADEDKHCHSWRVARDLLKEAQKKGERYEAFMLGYFGHLGADVVAHNHFVPERLVAHYRTRGIGHLYWEARYDRRLLSLKPEVQNVWRETSTLKFTDHDRFLSKRLEPTFFSNRLSGTIYRGSLGIQRKSPWQGTLARIDARSKLPLSNGETDKWQVASLAMAGLAIEDPFSEDFSALDPTGRTAIYGATLRRRALRSRYKKTSK